METNLKEKLQAINVKDTHARATFQYDNHGVQSSVTKDTTIYELALLGVEVHKEIVRRCAKERLPADEVLDIVRGMTEIGLYELAKEQLKSLINDDKIIERMLDR